jgi:hypothetical protein
MILLPMSGVLVPALPKAAQAVLGKLTGGN